jgi:hypothetical protein
MTQIEFDKNLNKFVGKVNGSIVCKGRNQEYIAKRLTELGYSNKVDTTTAKVTSEFGVNERFGFIERFVKMVAKGVSNSLIVSGPGGLGKTYSVINTLNKMGKTEMGIGDVDGDYVVFRGYSTAKAMYRELYENNGKIIIFDDTDSVLKDVIATNILKAALDSYDKRVISWGAEFKGEDDLPNKFEFVGRVIFISNLSIDKLPQAVVSRSLKCDVSMTTAEKVERIEYVVMSDSFSGNFDDEVKVDVVNFIKEHADRFTDLNIRSALNIAKVRVNDEDGDWTRMALYMAVA